MWQDLNRFWGVSAAYEATGALWIATDPGDGDNPKWRQLALEMDDAGVEFRKVSKSEARELCPPIVSLRDREVYYFEPGAIQLDPSVVRSTLYEALQKNEVASFEKTAVTGFERNGGGCFVAVITDRGRFSCDFVINAAGPWSPSIFGSLGLSIPVSVEPVNVANWITSKRDLVTGMPIIADYVNLAYFRVWRDGEIHMHQPRRRSTLETARAFSENPLSITGADFVTDPGNQALGYSQIKLYEDLARRRFNNIDSTVYGSGYRSYFDITPDRSSLKFAPSSWLVSAQDAGVCALTRRQLGSAVTVSRRGNISSSAPVDNDGGSDHRVCNLQALQPTVAESFPMREAWLLS